MALTKETAGPHFGDLWSVFEILFSVFIPAKNNNPHASLLESTLYQLKYLNIIDWFTDEVGYQRGAHRQKKLIDLCCKGKIDMIICYSKEDVEKYGNDKATTIKYDVLFYCVRECILMKTGKLISLS